MCNYKVCSNRQGLFQERKDWNLLQRTQFKKKCLTFFREIEHVANSYI